MERALAFHRSESSRDLENLAEGLDFLNTRDPERYLSQNFPGSRILRNPSPQLCFGRISKFRDDDFYFTWLHYFFAVITKKGG